MPGSFLSEADRERLRNFPRHIPSDDLITYFTLSPTDMAWVQRHRGDHNRLGTALQLCAIRYLGFCPDDLSRAPAKSLGYLSDQLKIPMTALDAYGVRVHTRTDHFLEAAAYLNFRNAEPNDLENLIKWLIDRALEHDRGSLLFQLAAEKLRRDKVVRPGVTTLERLVTSARMKAQMTTYKRMEFLLTDERQKFLDHLLITDVSTGRTPLAWLRQSAIANSPNAILAAIEKLIFLRQQCVDDWSLTGMNPNRLKYLAQLGKKSTNQAMQRANEEKRYPILLSFLHQMHTEVTDELLDLFIRCLAQTYKRSKQARDEFSKRMANSIQEKVRLFQKLGSIVLDTGVSDEQVRAAIYQIMSPDKLYVAVQESEQLIRPLDDNAFEFMKRRYSYIRTFAPAFLDACVFRSHLKQDPLLAAIDVLRQLNKQRTRKVPEDAPISFIPASWESYVIDQQGQIDRHYYELCALSELRNALRSGDIWVEGSRRYANPQSYLIPIQQWPGYRNEVCQLLDIPMDGRERLQQRQSELEERLYLFDQALTNKDKVRIENDELVISPLEAEELPESSPRLRQLIGERMPHVELTDLLIEVDSWTHFTRRFEHAGGDSSRTRDTQIHLYAGILAQACNFGLDQMAEISDISYRQLAWCNNWYMREDTLQAAVSDIVNFQYRQPLSRYWGGGTLSSSDGQRFPVSVKTQNATALPRYFGYGRGLTFYTWTSDQFSQYGTKVIPATVRDATYVLDAILDNETELTIMEHATDTTGYTEIIFALFDLLGLQFAPRIRDIGDQHIYRIDRSITYGHLMPLLTRTVNCHRILEHWDDLLRVAGSLKLGWVTASLLVQKIHASPRQSVLTRALKEYGRLIKSIFILHYLESEEYRRRINAQLNKGEELHRLRRFLFFANEGKVRKHYLEDQTNQATCLTLVTNAVITWNTVYMAAVIEQLRKEGISIKEEDLTHLSPARHRHINPYGRYQFNVEEGLKRKQLRPLRQTTSP